MTREGSDRDPRTVAQNASVLIEKWFGTLDEPLWPSDVLGPDMQAVHMDSVNRCAGPVGRGADKVERGVFRKHCVSCHGLSGDGLGAAAMLLEPYPRDFRRGTFKFKSTPVGQKPTREDIHRTLYEGIPGTAMPSFRALEESKEFSEDVDDLVEYVRYLAIRGEVERRVITAHVRDGVDLDVASEQLQQILKQVVLKWSNANSEQVVIPDYPEFIGKPIENPYEHLELMAKGKTHFESELTACVK
ncbi:MAG: c-type cytochrome, partial [Pirellula sp.]